jgi:hypothetical protein
LVSESVGCVNANTIVNTPSGLMFLSEQGIVLLTDRFQIEHVGRRVKYYTNTYTVRAGVMVPAKNHAIWFTTGAALVYNYLFDQWSTWTNHAALDAVVAGDNHYYALQAGASAIVDSEDALDDAGSIGFYLTLESGTYSFAKLLGHQRIYRVNWLAEVPGGASGGGDEGASATDSDLVALWRLNEAKGANALDASGNGHTAAVDAFPDRDPLDVAGRFGRGKQFSHTEPGIGEWDNRRYIVTHHADLKPNSFTLAAWVLFDGHVSNSQPYIINTIPSSYNYDFRMVSVSERNIELRVHMTDLTYLDVTPAAGSALALLIWHHVVVTYDHTTGIGRVYYNGAEVKNTTKSGVITPKWDTANLMLGNGGVGANFPGSLDEIAIYNVVKQPSWVAAQYALGAFPTFGAQFQFDHAPYWYPQQKVLPILDKPINHTMFYGAGQSSDYADQAVLLDARPDRQKSTAFRWRLTDNVSGGSALTRPSVLAVGCYCGVKRGPIRSPQNMT